MTALAGIRPHRFSAATYAAFRICEGLSSRWSTYPLPLVGDVATLDEALSAALTCGKVICHKDKLAIRETDEDGEARVHVYAIRKRAPRWVQGPGEVVPRRVEDLYPELVCVLPAEVWG